VAADESELSTDVALGFFLSLTKQYAKHYTVANQTLRLVARIYLCSGEILSFRRFKSES
jgi:hypothetical protein